MIVRMGITKAFTLIELLAVLVLMALLSSVVGLSFNSRRNIADRSQVVERLGAFDARSRTMAERSGSPVTVVVNLARGTLTALDTQTQKPVFTSLELPAGFTIREVRFPTQVVTASSIGIAVSPRGTSPTYALALMEPDRLQDRLLFVGLTGQMIRVPDETSLQNIFKVAAPVSQDDLSHDAH